MRKWTAKRKGSLITLLLLVIAASILILSNLGDHYLWQDEAQTALIAKTVITNGIPLGHDGRNSFSQDQGADYGKDYIWKWHPWLQFYAVAGAFLVLGDNTFAARLPFALIGIATVALMYLFTLSLTQNRRTALIGSVLLLINVPFLILVRQCRYYAPDAFFALACLYSYHCLLEKKKWSGAALFISGFLLFHTHYVHFFALLASLALHCLIFRRDRIRPVLMLSLALVIVNIPWIIWFSQMGTVLQGYETPLHRTFGFACIYLWQIGRHIIPFTLPLIILLRLLVEWFRTKSLPVFEPGPVQNTSLLLIFFFINLVAMSATATVAHFRFLAPLIPIGCLFIALIIESGIKIHRLVGLAVFVVVIAASRMPDYIYEITHDYNGPIEGIVKYLNKHGKPSDTVAITYGDMPLKFYTKMRVVGGLTGEDLSPAKEADWVIIRKNILGYQDGAVARYLIDNVDLENYETITLDYPDLCFENREDPDDHKFRTVTRAPRVVILRRDRL